MNIFEYVKDERRSFSQKAFSVLDSMVLAGLSYLHFDNIVPKEGILLKDTFKAENYDNILELLPRKDYYEKLYVLTVLSPRFRDIRIKHYVVENDPKTVKQFSATTFVLGDKIYVAYRGTDNTILGWNENFHMTYEYPVESQKQAVKYLKKVYSKEKKKMLVGGHSKGGNLALYAAINVNPDIQKNIIKAYSFDGPGFPAEVYETKEYKAIRSKIIKVVPEESIIGVLFEKDKVLVCKSDERGPLQHDIFFWRVKDNDLIFIKTLSKFSVNFNKVMMKWLDSATVEERELFVSTMFSLIKEEKIVNFQNELILIQKSPDLIRRYNKLSPDRKEFMSGIFKNLITVIVNMREEEYKVKQKETEKIKAKEKAKKEAKNKEIEKEIEKEIKKYREIEKEIEEEIKKEKNKDDNKHRLIEFIYNKYFGAETDKDQNLNNKSNKK